MFVSPVCKLEPWSCTISIIYPQESYLTEFQESDQGDGDASKFGKSDDELESYIKKWRSLEMICSQKPRETLMLHNYNRKKTMTESIVRTRRQVVNIHYWRWFYWLFSIRSYKKEHLCGCVTVLEMVERGTSSVSDGLDRTKSVRCLEKDCIDWLITRRDVCSRKHTIDAGILLNNNYIIIVINKFINLG